MERCGRRRQSESGCGLASLAVVVEWSGVECFETFSSAGAPLSLCSLCSQLCLSRCQGAFSWWLGGDGIGLRSSFHPLHRLFAGACWNVRYQYYWHDPGEFLSDRADCCLRFMCCVYWKPTSSVSVMTNSCHGLSFCVRSRLSMAVASKNSGVDDTSIPVAEMTRLLVNSIAMVRLFVTPGGALYQYKAVLT